MLFAGLVVSAVTVLLGIFTKLPQGGGGLVNNLMVMSCFLSSPPLHLPPPPPPNAAFFFDIDATIFERRKDYVHQHAMTCNLTQGTMPQCHTKPRPASNPHPRKTTFSIPTLLLPSLSPLLLKLRKAIAIVFIALSLFWLACTQLPLLAKIQKATNDSLATATVSGDQWAKIKRRRHIFYNLQVEILELRKALVEVERIKAMEKEREMKQSLKKLEKERDDAFKERLSDRENFERSEKQKKEEAEKLEQEGNRRTKVWEEKERRWEEKRAKERKTNVEDKERLKISRERERESWKGQVERLKTANEEEKEKLKLKIEKILKEKEQEKEGWEKEKEVELRKQEKLEMERERDMNSLEAQQLARSDVREIINILAQQRIAKLEEENAELRNAAMEREKVEGERKAARAILEEERGLEKKRWEQETAEAKKLLSKMEGDLLSGRKLIEGLQTDKRIDRQLLLELRAQLTRPTYHALPTHPSPLLFNGTAYSVLAAPNITPYSAPSNNFPQSPKGTLPSSSSRNPPTTLPSIVSSGDPVRPEVEVASPIVWLPPADPGSQSVVHLPPQPPLRQESPSQLPTHSRPPANAPKGPKGWRPNVPKAKRSEGPDNAQ